METERDIPKQQNYSPLAMTEQRPPRSSQPFISPTKPRRPSVPSHSIIKSKTSNKIEDIPTSSTTDINGQQKGVFLIYNFWLGQGNNSELVRRILLGRGNWCEVDETDRVHYKWAQSDRGYKYDLLGLSGRKEMCNHFQNYSSLNNKASLIRNLNEYCESQKVNMFSFTPATFIVDLNQEQCGKILSDFVFFYAKHHPKGIDSKARMEYLQHLKGNIQGNGSKYKPITNKYSPYSMNKTFLDDQHKSYLWVLKPTELNRGRGVRVFSSLESLKKLLKEYTFGFQEKPLMPSSNSKPTFIKTPSFVIQKYIERPFLINKRKFDIRTWALLDQDSNVYFFKEGYARLSSQEYNLSSANIDNVFIHLTNNAIQQHAKNYCKFEAGNQLSFKEIEEAVDGSGGREGAFREILGRMKEIVETLFKSVRGKINKENHSFCAEVFGLDFFVDEELRVWIIEVNTNPCLEESSPLLSQLIPRMLNDAFKLTVDVVFPKWVPLKETSKMRILEQRLPAITQTTKNKYTVDGYEDQNSMWEYVTNIAFK